MKKVRACSRRSDTIGESGAKWRAEKKRRKETEIKKLWNSPSLPTSVVFSCFFLFALSPLSELREQGKKAPIFVFKYSRTLYGSFLVIYQLKEKKQRTTLKILWFLIKLYPTSWSIRYSMWRVLLVDKMPSSHGSTWLSKFLFSWLSSIWRQGR